MVACIAGIALAGACGKKEGAAGGAPGAGGPAAPQHVDGTPHTDAAIKAWQGAGLNPEGRAWYQQTGLGMGQTAPGFAASDS